MILKDLKVRDFDSLQSGEKKTGGFRIVLKLYEHNKKLYWDSKPNPWTDKVLIYDAGDDTHSLLLRLKGKDIDKVSPGDQVLIENGQVWNDGGYLFLRLGQSGTLKVLASERSGGILEKIDPTKYSEKSLKRLEDLETDLNGIVSQFPVEPEMRGFARLGWDLSNEEEMTIYPIIHGELKEKWSQKIQKINTSIRKVGKLQRFFFRKRSRKTLQRNRKILTLMSGGGRETPGGGWEITCSDENIRVIKEHGSFVFGPDECDALDKLIFLGCETLEGMNEMPDYFSTAKRFFQSFPTESAALIELYEERIRYLKKFLNEGGNAGPSPTLKSRRFRIFPNRI